MSRPAILAIDIGSSSVRAALFDHDGKPLSRSFVKREWSFIPTPDGGSEMKAVNAFAAVCDVIDTVLARAKSDITHIAVCSFWHSLMGIDARGKPTTAVIGWADTRSRQYSTKLKKRFDESQIHNSTGAHFHSSFWPAKLLWLRNEHPQTFARTTRWLGCADYVTMRLTGEIVSSNSMASATGIFDQRSCGWVKELLRYCGVKRSQLAEIVSSETWLPLAGPFRRRWPQLANAFLLPAIGDGAADHVGSCGIGRGNASLMVGTSAAVRVAYTGEPPAKIPQGLWCYRIDERSVILGGALSDGGNLVQWCRKRFGIQSDFEAELRCRDPSRELPTVLPFFHGERSTGYREDARGAIIDLLPTQDGIDVVDASMRAVADRLADIYRRLESVTAIDRIVASGGGLRESAYWREMIAKALERKIEMSAERESALQGVVQLALKHIGTE